MNMSLLMKLLGIDQDALAELSQDAAAKVDIVLTSLAELREGQLETLAILRRLADDNSTSTTSQKGSD